MTYDPNSSRYINIPSGELERTQSARATANASKQTAEILEQVADLLKNSEAQRAADARAQRRRDAEAATERELEIRLIVITLFATVALGVAALTDKGWVQLLALGLAVVGSAALLFRRKSAQDRLAEDDREL